MKGGMSLQWPSAVVPSTKGMSLAAMAQAGAARSRNSVKKGLCPYRRHGSANQVSCLRRRTVSGDLPIPWPASAFHGEKNSAPDTLPELFSLECRCSAAVSPEACHERA